MRDLLRRWLREHGQSSRVADFLDAVNGELLSTLGDHLLVGPSHFIKSDLSTASLERIWTYNVFPMLEEHLWGQHEQIAQWRWPAVMKRFAAQLGTKPPAADEPAQDEETGRR